MTEAEWQDNVVDLAHIHGWVVAHFRPARTKDGWATAVGYDGKGFPDLVLAHPDKGIIFAELKASKKSRVTNDQRAWLAVLDKAPGGAVVRLWTPDDLPDVNRTLRRGTL